MKVFYFLILFIMPLTLKALECDLSRPLKRYHPKYATHFSIDYFKDFKILHVDNDQYVLSPNSILNCELSLPKILTPVKKVVMTSTTYLPALELIHQEKSLMGFQGKRYIVSTAFPLDKIVDVAFKFNPEYLLGLKADLIMGYDANLMSPSQRQVFSSLKIPVVLNKDFEEKNPLGRAEWLIFISSFYNQDEQAINIFKSIEKNYLDLKEKNLKTTKRPLVLVGEIQNGYWVTCGGESDLGQMIQDAGGVLALKRPSANTQQISLEELGQGKQVFDIWLTHNNWASKNERDIAFKQDHRYSLISAKNIYNNDLITNKNKSNDFWETGLQRPDLLLLDISALIHPEEYIGHKLRWYRKL
jgi:iron complex transport system substrate-binding protein